MPPGVRLTHFLCIPLSTPTSRPQLQASLTAFKENVTTMRSPELPEGLPERAIRPIGTIHLTLGVMELSTPVKVEAALKLLKGISLSQLLDSKSIDARSEPLPSNDANQPGASASKGILHASSKSPLLPISITLKGLHPMHTPSKTSILYAPPVDDDLRLYSFCQRVRDIFTGAELLVPEDRPLKLHATIVNTVYVPGKKGKTSGHGRSRSKLTFDARELLEEYEEFEWMSNVKCANIAICRMGAKKNENGDEEYEVEGEVELLW